jgi:1-deoxy-D-xylulose-5-phosphate synthase
MHPPLTPRDLKKLTVEELVPLAQQIRKRIFDVMSVNGGHLASNLGSIELTIALHYIFDSPKDKFIFDVSHQAYTHKLLTGRSGEAFTKIRKSGGLSGFTHPKESEHDLFFAGHAATALSLALALATERDLLQEKGHIIPIIGDATLTCGLAFEALNNICRKQERFVVILNDNAMSISRNVGHIKNILSRLLSNPITNKWMHDLEKLMSKIPKCGPQLAEQSTKISSSVKNLVSSAPFFEQFGLSYIGPIDGHDIKKMVTVFQAIQEFEMPVIIHLLTKKGNGVEKAEKDPIKFHGVKPFDPNTCEFIPSTKKSISFPAIFGKTLLTLGEQDQSIVAITPATSLGAQLDAFMNKFPKRSFDVGIAEGHAATFAGGLAKSGKLKVVLSIYSTFLQRALDHVYHDICLQEAPVLFAIDRAGLASEDGATHHGIYDISFFRSMPNMVICQPRDGNMLVDLLHSLFAWKLPCALRYPNMTTEFDETRAPKQIPLGTSEILERGEELLIIALGHMCKHALKLRSALLEYGIRATVLDPIFIKPLDKERLTELLFTHQKVVTLEEHSVKGGLGDEVNQFILSHGHNEVEIINAGIPELLLDHDAYDCLLEKCNLSIEQLVKRILSHFSFHKQLLSQEVH